MTEALTEQTAINEEVEDQPSFLGYAHMVEDLLDPYPLSKEGEVGDRMISFTSGKIAFAIVLTETRDSFLLAHPVTLLHSDDGGIHGRVMCPKPVTRVFKSSVLYVSQPLDLHRFVYLKFLMEDLKELPPLLEGKRLESAVKYLQWYRKEHPEVDNMKDPKDEEETEVDAPLKSFSSLYKSRVTH